MMNQHYKLPGISAYVPAAIRRDPKQPLARTHPSSSCRTGTPHGHRLRTRATGAVLGALFACCTVVAADDPAITFDSEPYLLGQFYVNQPIAVEGEPVQIHLAPEVAEDAGFEALAGTLVIEDRHGETVHESAVELSRAGDFAGHITWTPKANGLYTARAALKASDGAAKVRAELTIAVRIEERPAHFVWYKTGGDTSAWSPLRWVSLITNASRPHTLEPLQSRGITCLDWTHGPMHINMPEDREAWAPRVEGIVTGWANFAEENEHGYDGLGLDEFGGFRGTEKYDKTDAFLHEMNRQREALHEGGVIASWAGGGMPLKWASLHRQTADFVLLELYILGYFPPTTGTEEIYSMIDNRVDFMRARDMFTPSWGGQATTLIVLDSNMRHGLGHYHPGEIENVVRYLRRVAPEMRGLALYTGSGGKGEAFKKMRDRNRGVFDDLFFKYFIKPVATLQRGSLWVEDGEVVIAVSNIGTMDSGAVTVELWRDGEPWKTVTAESVPAGFSRHTNRALLRVPWEPAKGLNRLEARIKDVAFGNLLNARVTRDVFVSAE